MPQFSSVQSLSRVWLFATPWTTARQASLFITNSWRLAKPMSIESVMPSNHLILCCPLFLLPSIFPNIRVLSNESVLSIRWPKYWSFSFSISPSNEYSGQNWTPEGWVINYYKVNCEKNCGNIFYHILWEAWTSSLHRRETLTSPVISHTAVYSWTKYSTSQTCSLLLLRMRELNKVA